MADVLDIMELDSRPQTPDNCSNRAAMKKKKIMDSTFKKPEGMARELYALLYADSKDGPPLIPTDVMPTMPGGYKQVKAKLGLKKVRPWKWLPFTNPGRKDGFKLHHWRRVADENKEYPFAKFNKVVPILNYSETDYQNYLHSDSWTKAETDHLFELCRRFDLRFIIVHDRWDRERFTTPRSVEDIKERYYHVTNTITKLKTPGGHDLKLKIFDTETERKRKEQLVKLYNRTTEQVEEEQKLLEECRKIEMRKKEREKKTQDLQKLMTAADNNTQSKKSENSIGPGRPGRGAGRKKMSHIQRTPGNKSDTSILPGTSASILESAGIKFPENKNSGATLRSARMKLPASVGQKKAKAIEQLLVELNIELRPMPTEQICQHFNELRSDMVLLYELKCALANFEFELQTLKHQYEAIQPGKQLEVPAVLNLSGSSSTSGLVDNLNKNLNSTESPKKTISEVIDVGAGLGTPNRKRRAALEQGNLMRKLKKI